MNENVTRRMKIILKYCFQKNFLKEAEASEESTVPVYGGNTDKINWFNTGMILSEVPDSRSQKVFSVIQVTRNW